MFVGCDFLQIGIKHSTLGSVVLYPKAGENGQIDPGGLSTESDEKGITGSGEAIYKQTRKRWSVESPPIGWKRQGENTLEKVKDIANSFEECDFTFELADGTIYIGKGKIVGDLKGATFDSTLPLKFEGGGVLTPV